MSSKRVGAALQYALGLINLASVYHMVGKLAPTMSRGAVMTAKKLGASRMEIISTPEPGTVEKRYQCENRIGTLESIAQLFTSKLAEIEPDLSPRSREFIRQMAVQSFVCVPINYEKKALGIMAVENTNSRQHLAQSEISVLMGVASQTAASIINARSFKEIKKSAQHD